MTEAGARRALRAACRAVGVDDGMATLIRFGENAVYRLPCDVVARVGRVGQFVAAVKEVDVARWLESVGVPAVRAVPDVEQPVDVEGRPVTFWRALPPHRHGTPAEVAGALKRLHRLAPPTSFALDVLSPFVRLDERIAEASVLREEERAWLRRRLAGLRARYSGLPAGLPRRVVHGDAWTGNVVRTSAGDAVFLDLERVAIGPPEWDLVHTAIKHTSFGWISAERYGEFCAVYGHDVTEWAGFALFRDIREFRMTCTAIQFAATDPAYREQADLRLACLRGARGSRPWRGWRAVP